MQQYWTKNEQQENRAELNKKTTESTEDTEKEKKAAFMPQKVL